MLDAAHATMLKAEARTGRSILKAELGNAQSLDGCCVTDASAGLAGRQHDLLVAGVVSLLAESQHHHKRAVSPSLRQSSVRQHREQPRSLFASWRWLRHLQQVER